MRRTVNLPRWIVAGCFLASCAPAPDDPVPGEPEFQRDPALDIELISERGGQMSHASGQNCMECHQERGPGPGRFTAAGTLYGAGAVDAIVELFGLDGGALLEVEVDVLGNFYTTEPLPISDQPVLPRVRTSTGLMLTSMPFPTLSASCNLCHAGSARVELGG